MKIDRFNQVTDEFHALAKGITDKKRPDYTIGNVDVLHNFKSVGERLGIDPLVVWGVYFLKHVDAVCAYVKGNRNPSEPIEMRFADMHNYDDLGIALIKETENAKAAAPKPSPAIQHSISVLGASFGQPIPLGADPAKPYGDKTSVSVSSVGVEVTKLPADHRPFLLTKDRVKVFFDVTTDSHYVEDDGKRRVLKMSEIMNLTTWELEMMQQLRKNCLAAEQERKAA